MLLIPGANRYYFKNSEDVEIFTKTAFLSIVLEQPSRLVYLNDWGRDLQE